MSDNPALGTLYLFLTDRSGPGQSCGVADAMKMLIKNLFKYIFILGIFLGILKVTVSISSTIFIEYYLCGCLTKIVNKSSHVPNWIKVLCI